MKNKRLTIFSLALAFILMDELSKFLIYINFKLNESIPLIKNIFHLTYIRNFGAGFGIFQHQKWLLIFISILVIGIIFYYLGRIKDK